MSSPALQPRTRVTRIAQEAVDKARLTVVPRVRTRAPRVPFVTLVSLVLVLRTLATGDGESAANASIVLKTLLLYAIMVTGSIWEKAVFGRYLFAPAFYWEDMVSMLVLALHTAYLVALATGALDTTALMLLALAAFGRLWCATHPRSTAPGSSEPAMDAGRSGD